MNTSGNIAFTRLQPDESSSPSLHISLLGPANVVWNDQPLIFRTRKTLALLAYLAVTKRAYPREHLAALFWPDNDDEHARGLLRRTLSFLRQGLAAATSMPDEGAEIVHAERDGFGRAALRIDGAGAIRLRLDVDLVEQAATRVRRVAPPAQQAPSSPTGQPAGGDDLIALLEAAVTAYQGPFMQGVDFIDAPEFDLWLTQQRGYWQAQIESILECLTRVQQARAAFADAAAHARRWIMLNALSEPAYRALMLALVGQGDPAGGLAVYHACRSALELELGVEPDPRTTALADRLRRLDPSGASDDPALVNFTDVTTAQLPGEASHGDIHLPFSGRDEELERLIIAYRRARQGSPQVVVLTGEAGIGKTRLAHEFLRWATAEGADVVRGHAYESANPLPYQPFVDMLRRRLETEPALDALPLPWLNELHRLFPGLQLRFPNLSMPTIAAGGETPAKLRLFEAATQLGVLLARRFEAEPFVLFLDDMQWADAATRDLLQFATRRWGEERVPILTLLAVRGEDLAVTQALDDWIAMLARQAGTTELALGPLASTDMQRLLGAVVTEPAGDDGAGERRDDLLRWLERQTDGQPFFLVETLRTLVERGVLTERGTAAGAPALELGVPLDQRQRRQLLPGAVRGMLRRRLAGLEPATSDLLIAAAVLGPNATFARLSQVASLSERDVLAAIDSAQQRHLLFESGAERCSPEPSRDSALQYRFHQHLMRQVIYTEAGESRRKTVHRRAFLALEGSAAAAELSWHALEAGLFEPAFQYSLEAGDAALAVSAVPDAIRHYERAWQLLQPSERGQSSLGPFTVTPEQRDRLHLQLGRAFELNGEWERARQIYELLRVAAQHDESPASEGMALARQRAITRASTELHARRFPIEDRLGDEVHGDIEIDAV